MAFKVINNEVITNISDLTNTTIDTSNVLDNVLTVSDGSNTTSLSRGDSITITGVGTTVVTNTNGNISIDAGNSFTSQDFSNELQDFLVHSNHINVVATYDSINEQVVLSVPTNVSAFTNDANYAINEYSNSTPMPQTVGGWTAGSTFANASITEMLTGILYPYQQPAFLNFYFNAQATILEVGDTVSVNQTAKWATSFGSNISVNSIAIDDVTGGINLVSGLANDGTESIVLPFSVTKSSATSNVWRVEATNTQGTIISKDFAINWRWKSFYGTSASTVLDAAGVHGLINSNLDNNFTGNKSFAAGDYKWMAYPASMGLKTGFFDQSTGFAVAMEPAYTLSITNSNGISQNYYIHRTTNTIVGAITIGVS